MRTLQVPIKLACALSGAPPETFEALEAAGGVRPVGGVGQGNYLLFGPLDLIGAAYHDAYAAPFAAVGMAAAGRDFGTRAAVVLQTAGFDRVVEMLKAGRGYLLVPAPNHPEGGLFLDHPPWDDVNGGWLPIPDLWDSVRPIILRWKNLMSHCQAQPKKRGRAYRPTDETAEELEKLTDRLRQRGLMPQG